MPKKIVTQNRSKRYNVVLIVSDALRIDVLGCYGGDAKTPNINWLAAKGALFKNAYSTAPTTLPSSISMFTGNYSMTYGIVLDENKSVIFHTLLNNISIILTYSS